MNDIPSSIPIKVLKDWLSEAMELSIRESSSLTANAKPRQTTARAPVEKAATRISHDTLVLSGTQLLPRHRCKTTLFQGGKRSGRNTLFNVSCIERVFSSPIRDRATAQALWPLGEVSALLQGVDCMSDHCHCHCQGSERQLELSDVEVHFATPTSHFHSIHSVLERIHSSLTFVISSDGRELITERTLPTTHRSSGEGRNLQQRRRLCPTVSVNTGGTQDRFSQDTTWQARGCGGRWCPRRTLQRSTSSEVIRETTQINEGRGWTGRGVEDVYAPASSSFGSNEFCHSEHMWQLLNEFKGHRFSFNGKQLFPSIDKTPAESHPSRRESRHIEEAQTLFWWRRV